MQRQIETQKTLASFAELRLYHDWLTKRGYTQQQASNLFNYAVRYAHLLAKWDLNPILELPVTVRPNVLKGLSALSRYLGCHTEFLDLKATAGLRWVGKDLDDLIIERITRNVDLDGLRLWTSQVIQARPLLQGLMRLLWVTGLRFGEAVAAHDLLVNEAPNYYVLEKGLLEHFRFKPQFLRRTKKAYLSFVDPETVSLVRGMVLLHDTERINRCLKRRGIKQRFSEIREAWATVMSRKLSPSEIDFLQGRVGATVFMRHYFNPSLLSDLRKRVTNGIQ